MKRIPLALVVTLTFLVAPTARANHSWQNFHWARSSNPVVLPVIDNVTGVWDGLLPPVAAEWGASSVIDTTMRSGSTSLLQRLVCAPTAGAIKACNANYGPTGWFGIAQVWANGNHVYQATTKVNDFYFTGSFGNNTARRHVLCQEIGHDVGLDHVNTASCMNDNNATLSNPAYLSPNAHDYAQLESMYAHSDAGAKIGSAAAGSAGTRYVQTIGTITVITFITWVS